MYGCLLCGTREILLLTIIVPILVVLGKCLANPRNKWQEVGQDNSSEETYEQSIENRVVSNTAEWVERSILTKRKLS